MGMILASDKISGSETESDTDLLDKLATPRLPLVTDEIIGVTVEEIGTPTENIEDLTTITNSVSENTLR